MATQTTTKEKPAPTQQAPAQSAESKGQVVTLHAPRLPFHPAVKDRGFDEAQWRTIVEAVFPAAKTVEAVLLAMDYCKARKLDIFKRVVHIVPIWDSSATRVEDGKQKKGALVETVWPGIAEHRITAVRTGQYAGADAAQFGPVITHTFEWESEDQQGNKSRGNWAMKIPEWCQITVYKIVQGQRCPFPGPRVYWLETYSRKGRSIMPNDKWKSSPFQMIEKCSEASALRRAFPEEFGDEWTAEEAGAIERAAEHAVDVTPQAKRPKREDAPKVEPFTVVNGDGQVFDFPQATDSVAGIAAIFAEAKTKEALEGIWESNNLPGQLRDRGFPDLAQVVHDAYSESARAFEKKPEPEKTAEPKQDGAAAQSSAPAQDTTQAPTFTPKAIEVPELEDGARNWKAWGTKMVAHVKGAQIEAHLSEIIALNVDAFGECKDGGPNAYKSVDSCIEKRRDEIRAALKEANASNTLAGG